MARDYCEIIETGEGGLQKRFKAIGLKPIFEVTKTIDKTAGGGRDITYGGVYTSFELILRIPWAVTDTDYGTYADFKKIFTRNNPNGTITPFFTFVDHWGKSHENACFGATQGSVEPLCTIIENDPSIGASNAWFIVTVEILLPPGDIT